MINTECLKKILLLPNVKHINLLGGELHFPHRLNMLLPQELESFAKTIISSFGDTFVIADSVKPDSVDVVFKRVEGHGKEGYSFCIDKNIEIKYSEENGAFYALMTIRQLFQNGKLLRLNIQDSPKLDFRGYMLDVSRGKMPSIDSLKRLIDILSAFKFNHFELYFEGSPYVFPHFEKYAMADAYTREELIDLDEYCNNRYIEFTPNLNTLGHMSPWLSHKEFLHLAEKEDGLEILGHKFNPTTLDCQNPKALDFVLSLIDGLTPCYKSEYINVGLDEPFEIGKGKNLNLANKIGADKLYLEYVKKLHIEISLRNKTMLMWGDVAVRNPEIIKQFPQDIVLLDWGYQAEYPFESRASLLAKLGKKFILCPGTSSWLSISGITDNMMQNITNATNSAKSHSALGVMLTDWGDGGHIQHFFVSLPAISLTSALSWSDNCDELQLQAALDLFVFKDSANKLGKLILDLGRYANFEERMLECRTLASILLQFPQARGNRLTAIEEGLVNLTLQMIPQDLTNIYQKKMSNKKHFDITAFDNYINELSIKLQDAKPQCEDADILLREIANTINFVAILEKSRLVLLADQTDENLANKIKKIAQEHFQLWIVRNRVNGVEIGLDNLKKLALNLTKAPNVNE